MSIFGGSEKRAELAQLKLELEGHTHELAGLDDKIVEVNQALGRIEQDTNAAAAMTWEYLAEEDVDITVLDERGRRGWELVNAVSYTVGWGVGGNSSMKVHIKYLFKRPVVKLSTEEAHSLRAILDELISKRQNIVQRQQEIATAISGGI